MNNEDKILHKTMDKPMPRRNVLKLAISFTAAMVMASTLIACEVIATELTTQKIKTMKHKAYVYTELQLNATPFNEAAPWRKLNPALKKQPGLLTKTWLSGLHTGTPGGLYAFDTIENAQNFAVNYFPKEAASLNAAFYTRVFDANVTEAASRDMNSPFYN